MDMELFTLFHVSKEIFSERSSDFFILFMTGFESSWEGNLERSERLKIRGKYFFGFSKIDVFKVGSQRRFNFFNKFTNPGQMSFIGVVIMVITLFSLIIFVEKISWFRMKCTCLVRFPERTTSPVCSVFMVISRTTVEVIL